MEASSLFWELANRDRLNILKLLEKEKRKLSHIAEEVNESVQETYRNLSRLMKVKLVDKDREGYYTLTTFGKYILTVLPSLEFLCKHREYFLTHDLSRIPEEFIYRIGELNSSRQAPDTFTAIRYTEIVIGESREYVWIITEQILVSALQSIPGKISENISFKIIIPYKLKPPPGAEILEKIKLDVRYIDRIDVALILNEKRACIAFPRLSGEIDYRGFLVEDPKGHNWCKNLFQYYWNKSKYTRI